MPLLQASLAAALFLASLRSPAPAPAAAGLVGPPPFGTCEVFCAPSGGLHPVGSTEAACCAGTEPNPCPAGTTPEAGSWVGGNPLRLDRCDN